MAFLKYFFYNFNNRKILHVLCHNLSQIDVTKTLRPFQEVIICFTYYLEYCSLENPQPILAWYIR